MPEYCVICGDEINEDDGINYVEELTDKNINNAFYLSRDITKQYKPICIYEFDKPDGYIFIFDKNIEENPTEFLFKQGIVSKSTTNNHIFETTVKNSKSKNRENKLDFENVNNVCKIAENPHRGTISNKLKMTTIELPSEKGIDYLKEVIDKFGEKAYVLIKSYDDRFKRIQVYVNKDKADKFLTMLKMEGFFII
jgi:hypothetical protein